MILRILIWISTVSYMNGLAEDYRLPTALKPVFYDLEIITYLCENDPSFTGKVTIKVKCLEDTDKIVLHSKNLTILDDKIVVEESRRSIKPKDIKFDKEKDFLIIDLPEKLHSSYSYDVTIDFKGILDDNLYGYYRSSYFNPSENKMEYLAVTQFEATSARKAFPCFDEPGMKAVFRLKLGRPGEYQSISNTPLVRSEPLSAYPGGMLDIYEVTPVMSTYLLAFVVHKFEYRESEPTPNNVTFRIYARQNAINEVEFAKEIGPKSLSFFEDFFNVKYVLPKQDMVAIPDFSAGAMENWGLITYRETLLLFDNKSNSEVSKYAISNVISHELAHQWFGNLVTMNWWTDIWLNEGFATQMAAIATNTLFPEWNSIDYDTVNNVLAVFSLDSLKTSHPISVPVQNPKQISEIFDVISYKKGSFLLRMLIHFLGEDTFRKGVTRYLKKHMFGNAQQDDLWQALSDQAHEDDSLPKDMTVKEIMDTWTLQTGYPTLTITRNYGRNTTLIRQERFLYDNFYKRETGKNCWWIPITYIKESETKPSDVKPRHWLKCPCGLGLIEVVPEENEWILFNVNISALYRVNYDETNWKLLIRTLESDKFENIPVLNRVQLIDDSGALGWTGELNYAIHFNILNYLVKENNYLPWRAAFNNLDIIEKLLRKTSMYGTLKTFIKRLLEPIYGEIGGYKSKSTLNILQGSKFQSSVTFWSCSYKIDGCVEESQRLFKEWQKNPSINVIPKNLRAINYCIVLENGGETEWNFLWNQFKKTTTPAEKQVILGSLGCTKDIWLLVRYVEWSISNDSGLRKQDVGQVLGSVAGNEVGYYVVKNFLNDRLPEIYKYLGDSSKRISRVFMALATQVIETGELNELIKITKTHEKILSDSAQTIRQAIETAETQVQWYKKYANTITDILKTLNQRNRRDKE